MLKKLLKYDFRSVRRFGVPVLIALAAAGLLGAGSIAGLIASIRANTPFSSLLSSGFYMLFSLVAMVTSVGEIGIAVSIYVDYYKTLVTDEAYLTFTLPVRASDILLSKLINAVLWTVVGTVATLAVGFLMLVVGLAVGGVLPKAIIALGEVTGYILATPYIPTLILLAFLFLIAYSINSILLWFMAIFFGSVLAKKHKLLWVIGSIIVANIVYNTVAQTAGSLIVLPLMLSGSFNKAMIVLHVTLIIYTLALAGLSVLFFHLTKNMMEKRLNLA